ncbi:exopolysaccharide biosynthesis polyprenyl glycosylphosphotransferase [Streptomyces sp. BG9H]|uniref:Exopolysaccharide biosynthesis polyprenyl glycosylphosphotransferase n=1 Tax=Streptomyces anatolicus TaxID=2675858 RepID=A0ABS6YSS0_9ACTN|nr:exopolysaccharide biosynthesis polyprenyl glycosylphosphotransferase [Streptomyces anatolicus]MBW5424490.1 exopolysaccharide biosynthesis polyprenyl glycosylphosphotransferase [Streptomyces anatolicus]
MSAERTVASSSGPTRQDTHAPQDTHAAPGALASQDTHAPPGAHAPQDTHTSPAAHAPSGSFVIGPRGARGSRAGARARRPARRRRSVAALVAVDSAAALLALLLLDEPRWYAVLAPLLLVAVLTLNAQGRLYAYTPLPATLDEVPSLSGRIALGLALTAVLAPALPAPVPPLPLSALATVGAAQCLLAVGGRALVHWQRRADVLRRPRPVLVCGPCGEARAVAAALLRRPRCGMRPVGVVSEADQQGEGSAAEPPPGPGDEGAAPELPVLGTEDELHRAVIQNDVQAVLLLPGGGPGLTGRLPVLTGLGCDLWEIGPRHPQLGPAREGARRYVAGFSCRPLEAAGPRGTSVGKRLLDITVAGSLLLVAAPVLAVCALVLRAVEGPGVIFRQERVGKDGRLFTLLKFRTHRPADPQEAATRWSVADERRMNAFCRFLRSTSLDELPQLWNVLRGDMSLVGPRPERPFFVAQFSQTYPDYARRHRMPTGITGLAQIHGLRGDTSIEDRCRFDNAYIDSWSFWQDMCILLRTLGVLLRRTGS